MFNLFAPRPKPPMRPDQAPQRDLLQEAADDAMAVLHRADTTNGTLAALSGVLLTVIAAGVGLSDQDAVFPAPARIAMGTAAVLLAAVLVVLATAIWPHRGVGGRLSGVPHYAQCDPKQVAAELTATDRQAWTSERLVTLSQIAVRKHRRQRIALMLLAAAGLLLATAVIATVAA